MSESVNPTHTVRVATQYDAPEAARLFTALGFPTAADDICARWESFSSGGNIALVAAHADGSLAGIATLSQMVVLHRTRPVGRISALVVDAAAQAQGVGRALVVAAEQALAASGCGKIEVTSNFRLEGAHGFYERLGYERTSFRFAKDLPARA